MKMLRTLALLLFALSFLAAPAASQTPDSVRAEISRALESIHAAEGQALRALAAYDNAQLKPDTVAPTDSIPIDSIPDEPEPPADEEPPVPVALDSTWNLPELPRDSVDVRMPTLSGRILTVAAGEPLQPALDSARAGDIIELQAGASWVGRYRLRARPDSGWVVLRSSRWAELPEGVRVGPADAAKMARIAGGARNSRTLEADSAASGWRLVGLEIAADTVGLPALVNTIVLLPRTSANIILDRSYIHGTPTQGLQRCVILNSARSAVINSHLSECHGRGIDSQAIAGWNGPGPYRIENNYLAGAAENIMFGGAGVGPAGIPPSDIIIRRNHIHKPIEWQGGPWMVKNLLELKIAERVLIEDNILENIWANAQVGFAFNIKSENRNKSVFPNLATRDVTVRNNRIINARFGASIIGGASTATMTGEGRTSRVLIDHNLFEFTETEQYPRAFQYGANVVDLVISNNVARRGRIYDGQKYIADITKAQYALLIGNIFDAE